MESQQMMELLLDMKARLDENAKTSQQGMLAMNEEIDANTQVLLAWREDMKARLDENAKTHREQMRADMEEILSRMEEDSKAWQEKMKAERGADREQWKAKMDEMFAKLDRKASPEMMQSIGEHQEVPREEAAVIPVRGWKRRHRGRKQAAGRHGEPKELTQEDCGSWKKLAATCRKASRRATVAWRKRNVVRKSWTHGDCGPRKEVTAAGKKVTCCAGHRRKRNIPLYTRRS
jgi:hypothetical protein